jgi:TetR/AcrR family transcriptional regulator
MAVNTERKQRLSAEDRKAAIVEAAVHLFAEKGFRGTTTRELAAAVGVSEPVLYQHFSTKSELYSAIIEVICSEEHAETDAELEERSAAGDDAGFFQTLGEAIIGWYEEKPEAIRLLLYSALEGHELKDRFVETQVSILYTILTEYIGRRVEQGMFRAMDPYLAARAFTGMCSHQGMASTIFDIRDLQGSRKELVQSLVEIFLHGVRAWPAADGSVQAGVDRVETDADVDGEGAEGK